MEGRQRTVAPNKIFRILEPCIIMMIMATVTVLLPDLFPCRDFPETVRKHFDVKKVVEETVSRGNETVTLNSKIYLEDSFCRNASQYNEASTLLYRSGEETIEHLFLRKSPNMFGMSALMTLFVIYFPLACWSAGSAVSSGLVVPMLLVGATFGRMIGELSVWIALQSGLTLDEIYPAIGPEASEWAWVDSGAFALIGAAAFFGGVSRLTMSLTVIMIEITNDVDHILERTSDLDDMEEAAVDYY